ncbi:MAG: acyl-ACP--UDP-N-acetylglucosamine O-acyltransferase [Candidatus Omnitrophota bacterium]
MSIHPTAIIGKEANIDPTAEIGPYVIVEDRVSIAGDVKVYAHAYICRGTSVGEGTQIHMGAVIGHAPQDTAFKGGDTFLRIGKKNIIREYVTIHRGTKPDTATEIGDENYLMALSHVGHNCKLGNKIVIANGALLAGYVTLGDQAFVSGNVAVHQFCAIGELVMIGGYSAVNRDIPPYMTVRGPSRVRSVNLVGLRRAGFKNATIREIKEAFRLLYRSDLNTGQALDKISELKAGKEVANLVEFIKNSKRGIAQFRYTDEDKEDYGVE